MLARAAPTARVWATASVKPAACTLDLQTRGMAINLSALKKRIRATANVAKLTGVMKLVASSKLKAVEDALNVGRPFGRALKSAVAIDQEDALAGEDSKKVMLVVLTTDRGLCGGVNSAVTRYTRQQISNLTAAGHEVSIFCLGDKARAQVGRDYLHLMRGTIDSCFDKDPLFSLAAAIGERLVRQQFDLMTFIHNEFENTAKFDTTMTSIPTMAGFDVGVLPPKLAGYAVEPENNEEALSNMMEYSIAGVLYSVMMESQACEVSQRIIAMDNASTNAGDMVDRFTLLYNRARQAKITTELTEIISGAESLNDDVDED